MNRQEAHVAKEKPILTTADGAPIGMQQALTAGKRGPALMQDVQLLEQMQHFNRERIPERVVHAKGSGAYGAFTVTHDVTRYTRAAFLGKVGKKTEMFARFSTVAGERGAADAERDVRGFALKFYTEEGNWDLVGNNTPVFFVRDPYKFQMFIHTQKRDPKTNMRCMDMQWDFWSLCPNRSTRSPSSSPIAEYPGPSFHEPTAATPIPDQRRGDASGASSISRPSRASNASTTTRRRGSSVRIGKPPARLYEAIEPPRVPEMESVPPGDDPAAGRSFR